MPISVLVDDISQLAKREQVQYSLSSYPNRVDDITTLADVSQHSGLWVVVVLPTPKVLNHRGMHVRKAIRTSGSMWWACFGAAMGFSDKFDDEVFSVRIGDYSRPRYRDVRTTGRLFIPCTHVRATRATMFGSTFVDAFENNQVDTVDFSRSFAPRFWRRSRSSLRRSQLTARNPRPIQAHERHDYRTE